MHQVSKFDWNDTLQAKLKDALGPDFNLDDMHAELGRAESAMETYWARSITKQTCFAEAQKVYESFLYHEEYEHLVANEIKPVHCLDSDPCATQFGSRVARKLEWKGVTFDLKRGETFSFRPTDLVLVAAMASPKDQICERLASHGVKEAMFRTTTGVAYTLYHEVDHDLYEESGYDFKGIAMSPGKAINATDFVTFRS